MDEYKLMEIVAKERYEVEMKRIEKKRLLDNRAHILRNDNVLEFAYMLKLIEINVGILDLEMHKHGLEIDQFNEKICNLNRE